MIIRTDLLNNVQLFTVLLKAVDCIFDELIYKILSFNNMRKDFHFSINS